MNVIIYPNELQTISIVCPTGELPINEVIQKDVPSGVPYQVIDSLDLPNPRSFRNAWEANFSDYRGVYIDLDKAKVIYKQTADIRAASLSTPLTQEYMRLVAIGGDTTAVQAQLKAINAAAEETAYLDATTVDELVACWPPELGPNPFLPVAAAAE